MPVRSLFSGLLELKDGQPRRFAEIIAYEGSSIDPLEMFIRGGLTDYLGATAHVSAHESIALYPSDRVLGDSEKGGNARTVAYIRERYGRAVDTTERVVDYDGTHASYTYIDDEGNEAGW